jgi:flagellin
MSATVDAINAKSSQTGVNASLSVDNTGAMKINMTATKDITVGASSSGGSGNQSTDVGINGVSATATASTGFDDIDVSTADGASKALVKLDAAINSVNNMRADLGAVQNRFTATVSNLQSASENLSASRSRIQDTDFAAETANMTRSQILQQAGTAMLAQANQLPNSVMSLLR